MAIPPAQETKALLNNYNTVNNNPLLCYYYKYAINFSVYLHNIIIID